jgi:hypothetical protein
VAGRQGFEPRSGGPEPPVLPLDDLPASLAIVENQRGSFKAKPFQIGVSPRAPGTVDESIRIYIDASLQIVF